MTARRIPHNHRTEEAILGAVLVDPTCLRKLAAIDVEAFHHPKHQEIWSAIRNLEAKLEPIDPFTVENELGRQGKAEAVGGLAFLGELVLHGGAGGHVEAYADALVRDQVTRDAIRTLSACLDTLTADHGGLDQYEGEAAVQWARAELAQVNTRAKSRSLNVGQVVGHRMRELHDITSRRERGERVLTGVPTGIVKLDDKLGGYQLEILTLVGGRIRMGKSAVLMAAVNATTAAGIGAHVFSLEDSRSSYADRAIANVDDVAVNVLRSCSLQRSEFEALGRATANLKARKNWLYDDRPGQRVAQIVEAWRREGESNDTKLVAIDYINLIKPDDRRAPVHEQLDQIATDLMNAAKEDHIAVVAAAQIGRGAVSRPGGRPTPEDLKSSGALEERCKCAVLVHRGSVYGPPTEGVDWSPAWDAPRNRCPEDDEWLTRMELLIAKNSNGAEGDVWAIWNGPRTLAV